MPSLPPWRRLPRQAAIAAIRCYQRTLSPDHGPLRVLFPGGYCRFSPSCSEYAAQAIERYGLWHGIPKAAWRVVRCNPFSRGGQDLP